MRKLDKLEQAQIERIIEKYKGRFDKKLDEMAFFRRVFSESPETYKQRLKAIGFSGHKCVLDAGCGFGQWALELAKMNEEVSALDISSERVAVLKELAEIKKIKNIIAREGTIERLPYKDAYFDAIFCYASIPLVPWKETLRELYRVLKKGGVIYLNADAVGWFVHLWKDEPNKGGGYEPKEWAAKAFINTYNYNKGNEFLPIGGFIIEEDEMINELQKVGFEIIRKGPEGTINLDPENIRIKPFFKSEYGGWTGPFEILVKKS